MSTPSYCRDRFTGTNSGAKIFWPKEGGQLFVVLAEPHGFLVKPTTGVGYSGVGPSEADAVIDALGRMGCM